MCNQKCIRGLLDDGREGALKTVPHIQGLNLNTQSLSCGLDFFHPMFYLVDIRFRG